MTFESADPRHETTTSELTMQSTTRHSRHYNMGCIARPALVIRSIIRLFLIADVNKSKNVSLCQFPRKIRNVDPFKSDEIAKRGVCHRRT